MRRRTRTTGLELVSIAYYGGDFDQTLWLAPGTGPDGAIFGGLGSDLAAANFGYDQGEALQSWRLEPHNSHTRSAAAMDPALCTCSLAATKG